jgi:hypothetical protein
MPDNSGDTSPEGQAPFNWRDYLPVHPAADEYPLLRDSDPARFLAVLQDIRANGMHMSITFWIDGDGNVLLLDGRNRLDILAELGVLGVDPKYDDEDDEDDEDHLAFVKAFDGTAWVPLKEYQYRTVDQWSEKVEGDPYAIAASLNAHRRHLEPEQYRARIEASHARIKAAIKDNPEKSLRQIGELTGTDKNTVGAVKAKMEATGEVSPVAKTVGKDGKARRKPAKQVETVKKPKIKIEELYERAERLGFRIEKCGRGAFKLFLGDGSNHLLWTNAIGISSHLDEHERINGAKAHEEAPKQQAPVETGEAEASAEAMKIAHAAAEAKEEMSSTAGTRTNTELELPVEDQDDEVEGTVEEAEAELKRLKDLKAKLKDNDENQDKFDAQESAKAFAAFKVACSKFLPGMNSDDLQKAIDFFAEAVEVPANELLPDLSIAQFNLKIAKQEVTVLKRKLAGKLPPRESRSTAWTRLTGEAAAAVEQLIEYQSEFEDAMEAQPDSLRDGPFAQKCEEIRGIDLQGALETLQEAENAEIPLGFGRD